MNNRSEHTGSYRALLLLDEIERNNEVTQRDLSKRLGVALGLVNSYIKNLISKGYITIASIPKNRYKYFLTPVGLSEKSRLTYEHLKNFTNLYTVARKDFQTLFGRLEKRNIKRVALCGVDEVAEIAFLSLQETKLELVGVINDVKTGKKFFGHKINSIGNVSDIAFEIIIITSFQNGDVLMKKLTRAGVSREMICGINKGGWLKRIGKS